MPNTLLTVDEVYQRFDDAVGHAAARNGMTKHELWMQMARECIEAIERDERPVMVEDMDA